MSSYDAAEKHLKDAIELAHDEKYNAAFREFGKAIQLHNKNAETHAEFGSALVNAARYPEAIEQFQMAVTIDPDYDFDIADFSYALDHDIRLGEDLRQVQQVVDAANRANLFHRWGQVLVSVSYFDKAIEQFRKALAINPELDLNVADLQRGLEASENTDQHLDALQEEVDKLQNPVAWSNWGKTLSGLSKYPAAIEQFRKAIAIRVDAAEDYSNLGESLYNLGNYVEAVGTFRKALDRDNQYVPAHMGLGRALNRLEKYPHASKTFERAMQKAPSGEYLMPWQEAIRQLPNPVQAIAEYQQQLDKNYHAWIDNFAGAPHEWGDFLTSLGRSTDGAVQYARSLAIEATNEVDPILRALQDVLAQLLEPGDTMSKIQQVIEETNRPELYLQWGIVLAQMNNNDQALKQLSCALKRLLPHDPNVPIRPTWPWNWIRRLIMALQPSEDRLAGINQIDEVVNQVRQPVLWVGWGGVLADILRDDRRALAAYQAALISNPRTPNLVRRFTQILQRSSDQLAVIHGVETALQSASATANTPPADLFLAWGQILGKLNKESLADEQYRRAIRLKGDSGEAYYALGQSYFKQGRYREACGQFQKAAENKAGYAQAIFDWGEALRQSARPEAAVQKYLQAIRTDLSFLNQCLQSVKGLLQSNDTLVADFQDTIHEVGTAASLNEWGSLLVEIGRYKQAIEQHKRAIEMDPDQTEFYASWRRAMGKAGISAERIREYDQAIEQYANNADAYSEWANFLSRLNHSEQAVERYQKALEKDCKHSTGHSDLILTLLNLNEIGRAREQAQRLLGYEPSNWVGYYCLAWGAHLDGQYDQAIRHCELGIRESGGFNLDLYIRWAWAEYESGQEEAALQKLEEAIKGDPDNATCYFEYGNLLLELKRYETAIAQFQKAIELDPKHVYSQHNLAAIPYDQGQYEVAWRKWKDALKAYQQLEPALVRVVDGGESVESNEFYYRASVTQNILHKNNEAEAILKEGLAFHPQNTLILQSLASLNWEQKGECLDTALEVSRQKSAYHWRAMDYFRLAEKLLKERSDRYPSFYYLTELGNLYLTVEEYDKARNCFEAARAKDDKAALPYARLGLIHLRQKQPDKAIEFLREALARNPDDLDVQSNLAEAELRAERLDEGQANYLKVLAIAPNHVQSLIGLGEVWTALGAKNDTDSFSEAIACYSKALDVANNEQIRSIYLKEQDKAAVYYSRGYAQVQLYESAGFRGDARRLNQALVDFRRCIQINPAHQNANRAIKKIEDRLSQFGPQRLTDTIGPRIILLLSGLIFTAVQFTFFILPLFNKPSKTITEQSLQGIANQLPQELLQKLQPLADQKFISEAALMDSVQTLVGVAQMDAVRSLVLQHISTVKTYDNFPQIDMGAYVALTFGSLLFMVVGLYLPQVLTLKVAGIELAKSSVDQAQAGGTLGIKK